MTNHPGRRKPSWVADAEAVADARIAAIQWQVGDGAYLVTPAELRQMLREAIISAYGAGLRAQIIPPCRRDGSD